MRKLFFIGWWSLLGSTGVIALLRYLHPATFSKAVFTSSLCFAFIALIVAIANKRYE